jgi:hypothetical protein
MKNEVVLMLGCLLLLAIITSYLSRTAAPAAGVTEEKPRTDTAHENVLKDSLKEADIKGVKFSNNSLPDAKIPYTIITKMTGLYQADKNTTAFHLRGETVVDPKKGLVTKLWSHKARHSLEIVWKDGTINQQEPKRTQDGNGFSDISDVQRTTGSGVNIYFGYLPPQMEKQCIAIQDDRGGEPRLLGVIPYNHLGKSAAHCFAVEDFPIGVLPQTYLGAPGGLASLILIDIPQLKLLGDIAPPELQHLSRPYFLADKTNSILLGVDFYLDWLIMIDFREYVKEQEKKK